MIRKSSKYESLPEAFKSVDAIPAFYSIESKRYAGNPLCEALPPTPDDEDYLKIYSQYPPLPTPEDRQGRRVHRRQNLQDLNDLIIFFPEYEHVGKTLDDMLREAYVARNPVAIEGQMSRYMSVAYGNNTMNHTHLKTNAKGFMVMSISGMGKTTFARRYVRRYPEVIKHTHYRGKSLNLHQLPIVMLRVPHDGTIRSICIQFFEEVDRRLNTNYRSQAMARRNIGPMTDLMKDVARVASVGLVIIDELQNIKAASKSGAEKLLNLLTEIIEKADISVLIMTTPALREIIEDSVRNIRKMTSAGSLLIPVMQNIQGKQWDWFCRQYWKYTYLEQQMPLTPAIKNEWHRVSGGNSAFASMVFFFAQKDELEDRDYLDASSFDRAYTKHMSFLQPAIDALRIGTPAALSRFDDLLMSPSYRAARNNMGLDVAADPPTKSVEEFSDSTESHRSSPLRSRSEPQSSARGESSLPPLPTENPFKDKGRN